MCGAWHTSSLLSWCCCGVAQHFCVLWGILEGRSAAAKSGSSLILVGWYVASEVTGAINNYMWENLVVSLPRTCLEAVMVIESRHWRVICRLLWWIGVCGWHVWAIIAAETFKLQMLLVCNFAISRAFLSLRALTDTMVYSFSLQLYYCRVNVVFHGLQPCVSRFGYCRSVGPVSAGVRQFMLVFVEIWQSQVWILIVYHLRVCNYKIRVIWFSRHSKHWQTTK